LRTSEDKFFSTLYGVFGAGLGLLIFMFALDGWSFVFMGHASKPWNGALMLMICCGLGAGWGLVSYKYKDREYGSGSASFFHDPATAVLFSKRLMVIATSLAALYFIWQLARGL
jgi:hypothetical protein